jgi:hypothetical protein
MRGKPKVCYIPRMTGSRQLAAALAIALAVSIGACGGDNPDNPSPTPTPQTTRILRFDGSLDFGDVAVGHTGEQVFRIFNDGNATMTVASVFTTGGLDYIASWTHGAIAAGTSQPVTVRFTPAAAQNYSGVLTVVADNTAGANQLTISARGVSPSP